MSGFIAGALGILVLLALCTLLIVLTIGLLTKDAFRKQKDWFWSTSFWKRIEANKEFFKIIYSLVLGALILAGLVFWIMDLWGKHADTIVTIGLVALYAIWKIGKWILIFGLAYFVIKTVVNGIIEAVSDRVAEKMRNRD